jgi:predicted transcriptional regulator
MENSVNALAKKTRRSRVTIYKIMRELQNKGVHRLPTEEEVLNRKPGRPRKYNY